MGFKRKLWLGLITLVGLACLLYVYFAFWPTGFTRFEEEHAAHRALADQLVTPAGSGTRVAGKMPLSDDHLETIASFATPQTIDLDDYGFARWIGRRVILSADSTSPDLFDGDSAGDDARTRMISEIIRTASDRTNAGEPRTPGTDPFDDALEIAETLNRVERSLLGPPGGFPAFADFPKLSGIQESGYFDAAALAILRAAVRGRGEDATKMLVRFLDTLRILQHGQFPLQEIRFDLPRRLLLELTRIETFPDYGFDRAEKALRRLRLTPSQVESLRIAHTLRWREEFLRNLDDDSIPAKDNVWRRLAGGYPARIISSGFKPIQERSVDRITRAWAERGMPFEPRWKHIFQPRYGGANPLAVDYLSTIVMNQDRGRYPHRYDLDRPRENRIYLMNHNGEAQWLELAFAVARYVRDHRISPEVIGQLVPGYLDPGFLEEQNLSLSSTGRAQAIWSVSTWQDPGGNSFLVVGRWTRGELEFRRRGTEIQPRAGWYATRLGELSGSTDFAIHAPGDPGTLSAVQVTLLITSM